MMWTPDIPPVTSQPPSQSQKDVHELITYLEALSLTLPLKTLPWKLKGSSYLLSISLAPYNKGCTFHHHNLVSADWLFCALVSGSKFGSVACLEHGSEKKVQYILPKKQNWVLMCNWKGIASHMTYTKWWWGTCIWYRSSFLAVIYRKTALALSSCKIQKG